MIPGSQAGPLTLIREYSMSLTFRHAAGLALLLTVSSEAFAQTAGIRSVRVANGFLQPVFCTAPAGDGARLFVVEKAGLIKILNLQTASRATFLDLTALVSSDGERGLLGLAFHPGYAQNRRFYVSYTGVSSGETRIVEYQTRSSNPDQADPTSARLLLTFARPQSNHNGGWIGFGPDQYLYMASGDGGNGNDTGTGHTAGTGNAQDITSNLLGKLLRIDVDRDDFPSDAQRNYGIPPTNPFVGVTGDDEIWAYGLRNPWRCSFDRQTGDLYIADVGQSLREEINVQPGNHPGGANYGWRLREGKVATPTAGIGGPAPAGAVNPIYDYPHGVDARQGFSVTGGYVYRGPIASLRGTYFFADFGNRRIWSLRHRVVTTHFTDWTTALTPDVGAITNVASFGEDAVGNLYLIDLDGEIFRITETTPSPLTAFRSSAVRFLTQPPRR